MATAIQAQDSVTVNNTQKRSFFEKGNINGNLFYQFGRVSDFEKNGDGTLDYAAPVYRFKSSVGVNLGIRLVEFVYLRTTFYYNLNNNINAPWVNTDYTYTLERTRWDPNTFSYGYVNYEINKYTDGGARFWQNVSRGSLYVRYYNHLPDRWINSVGLNSTSNIINYSLTLRYAPCYWDNEAQTKGSLFNGKPVVVYNLRYTFLKDMYVEGAIHYYPQPKTKMHADPDFTYGFGYNTYSHLSVSFIYGNYAINRFPWNEKQIQRYGFFDGNFSLLLNFRW